MWSAIYCEVTRIRSNKYILWSTIKETDLLLKIKYMYLKNDHTVRCICAFTATIGYLLAIFDYKPNDGGNVHHINPSSVQCSTLCHHVRQTVFATNQSAVQLFQVSDEARKYNRVYEFARI